MVLKYLKYILFLIIIFILILGILYLKKHPLFKINTNQTAVIKEIKDLNKLETAQFTIEKIIDAETSSNNAFQKLLYGDRILLIAHGQVVAGFDLSKIAKENVEIDGSRLQLSLPAPEILYSKIDNDKTKVYDRRQGLLTKGNQDLESEARKSAEASIRQAACDAQILEQASNNVKKQLKTIFITSGFKEVSFIIPRGNCQ